MQIFNKNTVREIVPMITLEANRYISLNSTGYALLISNKECNALEFARSGRKWYVRENVKDGIQFKQKQWEYRACRYALRTEMIRDHPRKNSNRYHYQVSYRTIDGGWHELIPITPPTQNNQWTKKNSHTSSNLV